MRRQRAMFLVLALASGCAGRGGDDTLAHLSARSTATDVLASLAVEVQTQTPPRVGFAIPVTTKWGSQLALGQMRGVAGMQAEGVVVGAGGKVYYAPPSVRGLDRVKNPLIVRLTIDDGPKHNWFDGVTNVGRHEVRADLEVILDDAKRRWDDVVQRQEGAVEAALVEAGKRTPGAPVGEERTAPQDVFVPTWTAGRIVVVYARHVVRASERVEEHPGRPCTKYNRRGGPPGFCPAPMPIVTSTRRDYAADLALVVTYDADGRFVEQRELAPVPVAGPGVRTSRD
ncbi:MAG: hypothetical protein KF773_25900 [Deltaproteobacteria bacterium]|nr:hypothetical protein [Deltaproteobacteria bacterium]